MTLVGIGISFHWSWGWFGTDNPQDFDAVFMVGPIMLLFKEENA